jgi:hypothetical protein
METTFNSLEGWSEHYDLNNILLESGSNGNKLITSEGESICKNYHNEEDFLNNLIELRSKPGLLICKSCNVDGNLISKLFRSSSSSRSLYEDYSCEIMAHLIDFFLFIKTNILDLLRDPEIDTKEDVKSSLHKELKTRLNKLRVKLFGEKYDVEVKNDKENVINLINDAQKGVSVDNMKLVNVNKKSLFYKNGTLLLKKDTVGFPFQSKNVKEYLIRTFFEMADYYSSIVYQFALRYIQNYELGNTSKDYINNFYTQNHKFNTDYDSHYKSISLKFEKFFGYIRYKQETITGDLKGDDYPIVFFSPEDILDKFIDDLSIKNEIRVINYQLHLCITSLYNQIIIPGSKLDVEYVNSALPRFKQLEGTQFEKASIIKTTRTLANLLWKNTI